MTNYNLQEFKNMLTNNIKEENSELKKLSKKSEKLWNNIFKINEIDITDFLPSIFISDIKRLYEKTFLESKILSIQVFPKDFIENPPQNITTVFGDEEYDKDDNISMKVVNNYAGFNGLESYYQEANLYLNTTKSKNYSDEDG